MFLKNMKKRLAIILNKKNEFEMIFEAMLEYFDPNKKMTMQKVTFYYDNLKDVTTEELYYAQKQLVRTKEIFFFPSVAEILKFVKEYREKKNHKRIETAKKILMKVTSNFGIYQPVYFDDVFLNEAVRQFGGWEKLCSVNIEEFDLKIDEILKKIYSNSKTSSLLGISEEEKINKTELKVKKYFENIGTENNKISSKSQIREIEFKKTN